MGTASPVAIVTGGAAGIGAAICRRLVASGNQVVAADLAPPSEVDPAVSYMTADVTDPASVERLVENVTAEFGRLDVLVNNAGIYSTLTPIAFTKLSRKDWQTVLDVNVIGLANCCAAAVQVMTSGGRIVNIASTVPLRGVPAFLHYVASKGAVLGMTRALARELADQGIRVNAVAPGFTLSDAVRSNEDLMGAVAVNAMATRLINRPQVPDDVAGVVAFLAGPDADYLTGQTIVVDGGSVLH
jgi:NAD(P)-dependent dehydrogenase (short-subunit alcohol dehydrogenase family)